MTSSIVGFSLGFSNLGPRFRDTEFGREMAGNGELTVHRFPQTKAIDVVRWLPAISAFDRLIAAAVHDPDSGSSALEIHALDSIQNGDESAIFDLITRDSWQSTSRISSLRCSAVSSEPIIISASTFAGNIHFLVVDPVEGSVESEMSLRCGYIASVDLQGDGRHCVSVGEDGRVDLVSLGEGGLENRRVYDAGGLVSYTAVRWGSSVEFATGGLGFGLQWWDQRKPGGPVSNLSGDWYEILHLRLENLLRNLGFCLILKSALACDDIFNRLL